MWLNEIIYALLAILAIILTVVILGACRWRTATRELYSRLNAARLETGIRVFDSRELEDLPAPVQRYFRQVLKDGQPLIAAARIEHTGIFNMSQTGNKWRPFTSREQIVTQRPGFVWDARIRMAPVMTMFVHDAYLAGQGLLAARLFGLLRAMEQSSTPELAQGELIRFLAEGTWYPTVLLPSQGVSWESINDTRAGAHFTDGGTSVKLEFDFDEEGLISSVRSPGRYRLVDGVQVATPWQGRFWDYELKDDIMIPHEGEAAWLLPEGPRTYWRGRIKRIEYEYAK